MKTSTTKPFSPAALRIALDEGMTIISDGPSGVQLTGKKRPAISTRIVMILGLVLLLGSAGKIQDIVIAPWKEAADQAERLAEHSQQAVDSQKQILDAANADRTGAEKIAIAETKLGELSRQLERENADVAVDRAKAAAGSGAISTAWRGFTGIVLLHNYGIGLILILLALLDYARTPAPTLFLDRRQNAGTVTPTKGPGFVQVTPAVLAAAGQAQKRREADEAWKRAQRGE